MSQTILQDTARQPADATAGTLGAAPANERAVYAATQLVRPTGLDEVSARVELLTRVDRKYFVPVETFREFTALLEDEFAVLDIDGRRMFGYESVYFDTPDLATYRAHLQGRRRRFKLRTRTYVDSGACMLEVKLKGPRAIIPRTRMTAAGSSLLRHSLPAPTSCTRTTDCPFLTGWARC